jgi:hypothetical protein
MTTVTPAAELLSEIHRALQGAISPSYVRSAPNWSLYEVYNFCLVVEEATRAGANLDFRNSNDTPATTYTFRTRPSDIRATDPYTYALLSFANKQPLEVHVGVYISEKSMERIQCDVLVIHRSEADFFRQRRMRTTSKKPPRYWPDSSKVILAIECKYLSKDMESDETHEFVGRSQALPSSTHFYLVTNTRSIAAGHRVLANTNMKKNSAWQHEVVPSVSPYVTNFRGVLGKVFDNYISDTNNMS